MMPRRTIRATRSALAAVVMAAAGLASVMAATVLAGGCRAPGESAASARTEAAGGPLNLLLVTLDTVRSDHLGCYGDAAAETPHLDALARQGVRFAHASSPVPLTLPSHTTILTGLLPPHHGTRNNGTAPLAAGIPTLATVLAGAGYRTAAFVAAFVLDHRFGLNRGFAVYDDEIERPADVSWMLEAQRPGDQVVDRALGWLAAADARPFFLWVHLYDAHAPYNPPSPYRERHPGRPYDGAIAFDDAQVGRLLAALASRGLDDRTVVAIAADHGESLGEHGELTHGLLLYEPVLSVPLLLRAPGLAARRVDTPVSLVDLAPSLAGLLRQPLPAPPGGALDGRDLSAALLAGREPAPSELYAETRYPEVFGWSPLFALRRRELKYIAAPRPELYDLHSDPHETRNLAPPAAASATVPAASAAAPAGPAQEETTRGFAARLATIEASARAPGSSSPAAGAAGGAAGTAPAAAAMPDAETRRRLASLGYAAGAPPRASAGPGNAGPGNAYRRHGRPPLDPKQGVALFQTFQRAHAELQAGQTAAALADLEPLTAADPGNPVFRTRLAQALRESGRTDRAIALYREVAALTPTDPEAWYNLAAALQESGRTAAAREAIDKAVRLDPGRPEAHNTLGIVYLAERRLEPARQEFLRATADDPRNAPAWNNLGNVLRSLRRPDEAAEAYRRAIAVAPHYAEPLNGLGALEVERDRPAAALPFFERALALAPDHQEVRLNRAIALQLAGDAAAAAGAYRDFLRVTDPEPRRFAEQRQAARHFLAQITQITRIAQPALPAPPPGGR
ncbi:MAG TPA: sulfatase-like hydrolase/transferase [Thermoanaerobaculia bacterium]